MYFLIKATSIAGGQTDLSSFRRGRTCMSSKWGGSWCGAGMLHSQELQVLHCVVSERDRGLWENCLITKTVSPLQQQQLFRQMGHDSVPCQHGESS